MKHLKLFLLAALLSSCNTVTHTSSPAAAYSSTQAHRSGVGSYHIVGEWDYLDYSMVKEPKIVVVAGFEAFVTRGQCLYAYYVHERTYGSKASSVANNMDVLSRHRKHLEFTREKLDEAARGNGLTVRFSEEHNTQFFSAAYLRGFLQKVDEVRRSIPAQPGAPAAPPRKKRPDPASFALSGSSPDRHL